MLAPSQCIGEPSAAPLVQEPSAVQAPGENTNVPFGPRLELEDPILMVPMIEPLSLIPCRHVLCAQSFEQLWRHEAGFPQQRLRCPLCRAAVDTFIVKFGPGAFRARRYLAATAAGRQGDAAAALAAPEEGEMTDELLALWTAYNDAAPWAVAAVPRAPAMPWHDLLNLLWRALVALPDVVVGLNPLEIMMNDALAAAIAGSPWTQTSLHSMVVGEQVIIPRRVGAWGSPLGSPLGSMSEPPLALAGEAPFAPVAAFPSPLPSWRGPRRWGVHSVHGGALVPRLPEGGPLTPAPMRDTSYSFTPLVQARVLPHWTQVSLALYQDDALREPLVAVPLHRLSSTPPARRALLRRAYPTRAEQFAWCAVLLRRSMVETMQFRERPLVGSEFPSRPRRRAAATQLTLVPLGEGPLGMVTSPCAPSVLRSFWSQLLRESWSWLLTTPLTRAAAAVRPELDAAALALRQWWERHAARRGDQDGEEQEEDVDDVHLLPLQEHHPATAWVWILDNALATTEAVLPHWRLREPVTEEAKDADTGEPERPGTWGAWQAPRYGLRSSVSGDSELGDHLRGSQDDVMLELLDAAEFALRHPRGMSHARIDGGDTHAASLPCPIWPVSTFRALQWLLAVAARQFRAFHACLQLHGEPGRIPWAAFPRWLQQQLIAEEEDDEGTVPATAGGAHRVTTRGWARLAGYSRYALQSFCPRSLLRALLRALDPCLTALFLDAHAVLQTWHAQLVVEGVLPDGQAPPTVEHVLAVLVERLARLPPGTGPRLVDSNEATTPVPPTAAPLAALPLELFGTAASDSSHSRPRRPRTRASKEAAWGARTHQRRACQRREAQELKRHVRRLHSKTSRRPRG